MRVLGIEPAVMRPGWRCMTPSGACWRMPDSQVEIHAENGGVPELASRDHVRKTLPLIDQVPPRHERHIDGVAYTAGPGLVGALMVGATLGRSIAAGLGVPSRRASHGGTYWRRCWVSAMVVRCPYLS